jgi:hypothetical protein
MNRPLAAVIAPLTILALGLTLTACQDAQPDTADATMAEDLVIDEPGLTLPPEESETPPPIGEDVGPPAPGARTTGPVPPLPSSETQPPSPADSPPAPDA